MRVALRMVAASLIVSLLVAGSLAPAARAQQPPAPAAPAPSAPPPPPARPEVLPETLKVGAVETRMAPEPRLPLEAYDIAAGVATAFLVPGRALTCVAGGALGIVTLAITFGTGYRFATSMLEEGCGGKWVVTGEDLLPDRPVLTDRPEAQ